MPEKRTFAQEPTFSSEFGSTLRLFRERSEITQRVLAMQAGINHSLVSRIEKGTVSPSLDTAVRLASALRLEPQERLYLYEKGLPVQRRAIRLTAEEFSLLPNPAIDTMSE